ncbi:MAG: ABC transporter permease [Solirubrobacteraceae bacterium]
MSALPAGLRTLRLPSGLVGFAFTVAAAIAALLLALVLVLSTGATVSATLDAVWNGTFATPFSSGTTINRIVVLALVGGGYVIAARSGLVNVGGEGQIAVGGVAAAAVALKLGPSLPGPLAIAVPLVAGALGGAFWAAIAGVLKARRGTNEVISTLLLNFVGLGLVSLVVHETALLRRPKTGAETLPITPPMPDPTQIPLLNFEPGSPANVGVIIAGALLFAAWVMLKWGTLGVRLRAVGLSAGTALRAGISAARTHILALSLSGALGGVAGALLVVATPFVLQEGFSAGYGFDGLIVGLLARSSILGAIAGAILFGSLRSGGVALEVGVGVPSETVLMVGSLLAIILAGASRFLDRTPGGSA